MNNLKRTTTMKRMMTIALVLLAGLTASAQGKWTYSNYQADELKGQEAYTAYQYEVPGVGSYVSWGWKDPDFRLITARGIFEESVCYEWYGSFRACRVLVGIYNAKGELQEKFYVQMYKESSGLGDKIHLSAMKKQQKLGKKISKALSEGDGFVRFICSRFSQSDFDLAVPHYPKK